MEIILWALAKPHPNGLKRRYPLTINPADLTSDFGASPSAINYSRVGGQAGGPSGRVSESGNRPGRDDGVTPAAWKEAKF